MADVRPFRALRPRPDLAGVVIAPPYDVLTDGEARALALHPKSFVRVTRSEATLPAGTDPHSDQAYTAAREQLDRFVEDGTLIRDPEPRYYFYGQKMGTHQQVGILAACSVDEYRAGTIAKHEFTRPDKEDDRTHHMTVLGAQVGLVFLAYRASETLSALTAKATAADPEWKVTTEDGVLHSFWVAPPALSDAIARAFAEVGTLYIADGHHRSAAAARVHEALASQSSSHFVCGLFPDDNLQVMAYNRVVNDLNGLSETAFLEAISQSFTIASGSSVPSDRGTFSMYFQGRWHTLTPRQVDHSDPVKRLDVSVLQDLLLGPILGIADPRRSSRIRFVGGIRGAAALEQAVDSGAAVAFHLFPTGLDQLFDVADAGEVMPPKSTWFEPKLRGGVAIRLLR